MQKRIVLLTLTTFMLAACSSAPTHQDTAKTTPAPGTAQAGGGYLAGDGPNSDVPAGIDDTPDAIPRAEPLHRYANRPYKALGKEYTPLTSVGNYKERGIASWYGKKFNGQRTSIGETYDMYAMSAAHPTLPIPSYARVTNLRNHKSVVVRVNDRGPFLHDRIIDLSFTAAHKLGIIGVGSAEVEVESLAPDAVISPAAPVASVESTPLETPPLSSTPLSPVVAAAVTPPVAPATTVTTAQQENVYLQLGAFNTEHSAKQFLTKMRQKLGHSPQQLVLLHKGGLMRVQIGPYTNIDEARTAAAELHSKLGVKPFVSLK
jgi:rare lipoprotein A